MIRGVIFDLGGTLVDFRSGLADWRSMELRGIAAFYRFLTQNGNQIPETEFADAIWNIVKDGWKAAMAGQSNLCLPDVLVAAAAYYGINLDAEASLRAARIYAAGVGDVAVPLEGAGETLRGLKERGLRLGLLSNTMWPSELHLNQLEALGLAMWFDVLAFSCETGLWKPTAPAFRDVTDRLGLLPEDAVFVGDLPDADVAGAQRAGLRAVWIDHYGFKLGDVRPDAIIQRLADLPGALEQLERSTDVDC